MLSRKLVSLAALVLTSALFAPSAFAVLPGIGDSLGYSPFANYKTIETDHFRINFPEELSATAQKTANYLEEAHHVLSQFLYWEASYKVNINILDNQDSENGLTTPEL